MRAEFVLKDAVTGKRIGESYPIYLRNDDYPLKY
jgi:hypothetical protein